MITSKQFSDWLQAEDIYSEPIENGVRFAGDNPWDEVQNGDYHGTLRLIDGTLHVDFVEDGWNGYGTEQFTDIKQFASRWTDVIQNGLMG